MILREKRFTLLIRIEAKLKRLIYCEGVSERSFTTSKFLILIYLHIYHQIHKLIRKIKCQHTWTRDTFASFSPLPPPPTLKVINTVGLSDPPAPGSIRTTHELSIRTSGLLSADRRKSSVTRFSTRLSLPSASWIRLPWVKWAGCGCPGAVAPPWDLEVWGGGAGVYEDVPLMPVKIKVIIILRSMRLYSCKLSSNRRYSSERGVSNPRGCFLNTWQWYIESWFFWPISFR